MQELFVLYRDGNPIVTTSQGKKQPKVYLTQKNANHAKSNMRDPKVKIVPYGPKEVTE